MADDNSIVFRVEADDADAQKKLASLRKDIDKTAKAIENTNSQRNSISDALKDARKESEATAKSIQEIKNMISEGEKLISNQGKPGNVSSDDYNRVSSVIAEQKAALADQEKLMARQQAEVNKLEGKEQQLLATLTQQTNQLEQQKREAGAVEQVIARQSASVMPDLKSAVDQANASINKGFKSILKWGFGIKSTFILVRRLKGYIKEAVSVFAEQDEETKANIDGLKSSLQTLKLSWGAAFAPAINAVIPLLQKLISWITSAANATARFFAVLSGKNSYKKIVKGAEAMAGGYEAAGDAAEEAKKQIMGFDEINQLNDDRNKSGGGGGGGGAGGVETVEEMIDKNSLAARLAFAVRDVFFDWSDLTPEQIAEKALAGLLGLGGMIVGGMVGGVPGAVIGLVAGLALGILADSTIFNFDGELSRDELFNALKIALGTIGGGVIGLMIGGPLGAVLGMAIGFALSFSSITIGFDSVRAKIDEWGARVRGYFAQYINKWKQSGSESGNSVGFYVVMGILEGLWDGIKAIENGFYQRIIAPIIQLFKDGFQISSPSKVMEEIGRYLIEGLWQGVLNKWNDFTKNVTRKFDEFKAELHSIKDLFRFEWNIPAPKLPHFRVDVEDWGIIKLPRVSVDWYAKGGIFDKASMIGVGEAGREAVLPLDRNTGWIKDLAEQLLDSMSSRYSGALRGLPAMAMGTIIPPMAMSGSSSMNASDIAEMIANALGSIGVGTNDDRPIYIQLDGRTIAQSTTKYQKQFARASG